MNGLPDNRRFAGRRILLTGGASGIGRESARLFVAGGARVAILDRNAADLARAAAELNGVAIHVDVTDEAAVIRAVEEAARVLGGLDGLVNAAGVAGAKSLLQTSRTQWQHIFDVNLLGPFLVTRAAVPFLRQCESSTIVNVSSGIALRPFAGQGAYAASKAGLLAWTKVLAQELAPRIRVNATCPGSTDTPLMRANVPDGTSIQELTAQYALQRQGTVLEQAQAIAFLTAAESSFITGVSLAVDGGRTFH